MRLKNKKTGEIVDLVEGYIKDSYYGQKIEIKPLAISNKEGYMYNSLAELNEDWEDYEEPKGKALYWMILTLENFIENEPDDKWVDLEDCKQMLEKLKALQRLKDKGFRFDGYGHADEREIEIVANWGADEDIKQDLLLLFGGEESDKDAWEKMQAGEWHCACCDTYLEPIDSTHVICPRCGLKHRFKNGVIQTKGNMMEDYE